LGLFIVVFPPLILVRPRLSPRAQGARGAPYADRRSPVAAATTIKAPGAPGLPLIDKP